MTIDEMLVDSGDYVYYTDGFHVEIESHFPRLLDNNYVVTQGIDKQQGVVYEGDFFGLLRNLGIPDFAHYATLRLNGYSSPMQFKRTTTTIMVPNLSEIEMIKSVYVANEDFII